MEQDWVIFITGIIFCSIGIILTLMVLVFNIRFMRLRWVKILFKISAFGTKMFSYLITLFNLYTFVCYRNNMKIKFDKNSANMMRGFSDHLPLYFLLFCYQVKVKTGVILQRKRIVRKVCRKRSVLDYLVMKAWSGQKKSALEIIYCVWWKQIHKFSFKQLPTVFILRWTYVLELGYISDTPSKKEVTCLHMFSLSNSLLNFC